MHYKSLTTIVLANALSLSFCVAQTTVVEEWNKVGIKGVSYISPETAHEWQSWRRSLYQFAQLIFK